METLVMLQAVCLDCFNVGLKDVTNWYEIEATTTSSTTNSIRLPEYDNKTSPRRLKTLSRPFFW